PNLPAAAHRQDRGEGTKETVVPNVPQHQYTEEPEPQAAEDGADAAPKKRGQDREEVGTGVEQLRRFVGATHLDELVNDGRTQYTAPPRDERRREIEDEPCPVGDFAVIPSQGDAREEHHDAKTDKL